MKTEPNNLCSYCVTPNCLITINENMNNYNETYPEITTCNDFKHYLGSVELNEKSKTP